MRSDLTHLGILDHYGDRCATLAHEPLRVTVTTLTPVVAMELLNLDGLLAYGMVRAEWGGWPFPASDAPYWLPLPLAYTEHAGLPLWQSTCLFPVDQRSDSTHYHKRTEANPYSFPAIMGTLDRKKPRRQPVTGAGQYMNYRIPEPYHVAARWEGLCLGHRDEVARLLAYVPGLGKDLAQGYGRILAWEVEPWPGPVLLDDPAHGPLRPVPTDTGLGTLQAWTPPYWRRDLWLPCRVPSLTGSPWASRAG
jgi:CRISPR type IV-associated protein Csf3